MTELEVGQRLRNRLIKEGGFVWSHKDGSKTVHFNRGKKPSAELVAALKKYRKALAKFIDHYHKKIDRAYQSLPPPFRFSQCETRRNANAPR